MSRIRTIIVTMPGTWQKVLQNVLVSNASVEVVDVVHGGISAVLSAKEHHPDLLLIDASIPLEETAALIDSLKQEHPETRYIVLADTHLQRREAARAGADYTLSSFNYAARIKEILNELGAAAGSVGGRETVLDGE